VISLVVKSGTGPWSLSLRAYRTGGAGLTKSSCPTCQAGYSFPLLTWMFLRKPWALASGRLVRKMVSMVRMVVRRDRDGEREGEGRRVVVVVIFVR